MKIRTVTWALLLAMLALAGLPAMAQGEGSAIQVAYLGPEGTYSQEAARLWFSHGEALVPMETAEDAVEAMLRGDADHAVIPQENTLGGAIDDYVDAMIASEDIYVTGEVILPVSQALLGLPGAQLEDITLVCSHVQGLTQSSAWREMYLPDAETMEMASTAAAAAYVAETGDRTVAAVASASTAELYGLEVLAEDVQITDTNATSFSVLSTEPLNGDKLPRAVFVATGEAKHIAEILLAVRSAGMEMVSIHDRPEGSDLGIYHYVIEVQCEGGILDGQIGAVSSLKGVRYAGRFQTLQAGSGNTSNTSNTANTASAGTSKKSKSSASSKTKQSGSVLTVKHAIPVDRSMDTVNDDLGAYAYQGRLDHSTTQYYVILDYYDMTSGGTLHILPEFETYQQTTEYTSGCAAALMVLHRYGIDDYNEMQIADLAGADVVTGTTVQGMADFFDSIGLQIEFHASTEPRFENIDQWEDYLIQSIDGGVPIIVDWLDWGGHWQVIIGIDTCDTDETYDDVLIVADPYDVTDHYQDGYYNVPLGRFFAMWREGLPTDNPAPYVQPFISVFPPEE